MSVDLRGLPGRLLAVGDVHGRFDLLDRGLVEIGYDRSRDRIAFLGDLVNRGPHSVLAEEWWDELRVIGNHEEMISWWADGSGGEFPKDGSTAWFEAMPRKRRKAFAQRLADAPVALEVTTPAGRRVGLVHAQVPVFPSHDWRRLTGMLKDPEDEFHQRAIVHAASARPDWYAMRAALEDRRHRDAAGAREQALWARTYVTLARMGYDAPRVDGIDHVFHGHTKVATPLVSGNCSWIDTGAYETGRLTIVDVDAWMDGMEKTLPPEGGKGQAG